MTRRIIIIGEPGGLARFADLLVNRPLPHGMIVLDGQHGAQLLTDLEEHVLPLLQERPRLELNRLVLEASALTLPDFIPHHITEPSSDPARDDRRRLEGKTHKRKRSRR